MGWYNESYWTLNDEYNFYIDIISTYRDLQYYAKYFNCSNVRIDGQSLASSLRKYRRCLYKLSDFDKIRER